LGATLNGVLTIPQAAAGRGLMVNSQTASTSKVVNKIALIWSNLLSQGKERPIRLSI
jgi:hypothetical protein